MKRPQILCCGMLLLAAACSSSTPSITERKSDILLKAGIESLQENDPTQALRSLQEAARLAPKQPAIWSNLGVAYARKEENVRAEECWKKALQINPAFHDAQLNLGALYLKLKRYSEAERFLNEAGNDPSYASAYQVSFELAELYLAQGKKLAAEQQLKKSVLTRPNFCLAWFRLGQMQKDRGEYLEAAHSLKGAVSGICYKNPEAHYEIASLYLKANDYGNAKTKLLEIIQLFPESEWAKKAVLSLNEIR